MLRTRARHIRSRSWRRAWRHWSSGQEFAPNSRKGDSRFLTRSQVGCRQWGADIVSEGGREKLSIWPINWHILVLGGKHGRWGRRSGFAYRSGSVLMQLENKHRGLGLFGTGDDIAVQRGIAEFQAGRPVVLEAADERLVALPGGGLTRAACDAFKALCGPAAVRLVVTARRALIIGIDVPGPVSIPL